MLKVLLVGSQGPIRRETEQKLLSASLPLVAVETRDSDGIQESWGGTRDGWGGGRLDQMAVRIYSPQPTRQKL